VLEKYRLALGRKGILSYAGDDYDKGLTCHFDMQWVRHDVC